MFGTISSKFALGGLMLKCETYGARVLVSNLPF